MSTSPPKGRLGSVLDGDNSRPRRSTRERRPARFEDSVLSPPKKKARQQLVRLATCKAPGRESRARRSASSASADAAHLEDSSDDSASSPDDDSDEDADDELRGAAATAKKPRARAPLIPIAKQHKPTLKADVERILTDRKAPEGGERQLLIKFKGVSYRSLEWVDEAKLQRARPALVKAYFVKKGQGNAPVDVSGTADGIFPEWRVAERVFDVRRLGSATGPLQYLVKWRMLGYAESTWELERNMTDTKDRELIEAYKRFSERPVVRQPTSGQELVELLAQGKGIPSFKNGRSLRSYQQESFKWMVQHNIRGQNCILGDEMGLGKTAQSIAVMEFRRTKAGVRGPFLVVAPLTTLGHWQREIETWTDMNVVAFMGSADDRHVIHEFELYYDDTVPTGPGRDGRRNLHRFDVLLTSFELLRDCMPTFRQFRWDIVIVDEAHRLKALHSQARVSIRQLQTSFMLLLTGTPIQNNMRELFSMMNLCDDEKFDDVDEFLERFGDPPRNPSSAEQLQDLQKELRPILLRRMKEDVEKLPDKEEVIIWVELTDYQRSYYKALYEKEIGTLLGAVKKTALPNMRNLAMELRKICCHPFLCNGLEDDLRMRLSTLLGREPSDRELMESASGKISLLSKLLPKLRSEGHKVLVFSQFKILLDLVQHYLDMLDLPWERIDGDTPGQMRQVAMDRFQAGGEGTFCFMLSTRAGGQGITLTAADTIIIYDSDWNPQNDIQAMARAHRIGQTRNVSIYRLITQRTYEESLISTANQKSGLNEAILGNINTDGNPHDNAQRIAQLLREGAHSLMDDSVAQQEAAHFAAQGIDEILAQRTSKRSIASKPGSSFSVASFRASDGQKPVDDESFWQDLLPEAVKKHQQALAAKNIVHGKRRTRTKVNYREPTRPVPMSDDEDFEPSASEEEPLRHKSPGAADGGPDTASRPLAADGRDAAPAGARPGSAGRSSMGKGFLCRTLTGIDTVINRFGPLRVQQVADRFVSGEVQLESDTAVVTAIDEVLLSSGAKAADARGLVADWATFIRAGAVAEPLPRQLSQREIDGMATSLPADPGQTGQDVRADGDGEVEREREAAQKASEYQARRVAEWSADVDKHVRSVLAEAPALMPAWPQRSLARAGIIQNIIYRGLRSARKRTTAWRRLDALTTALERRTPEQLLQAICAGSPMPQIGGPLGLDFLARHGLWAWDGVHDARLLEHAFRCGVDLLVESRQKAEGARIAHTMWGFKVGGLSTCEPVVSVEHPAWQLDKQEEPPRVSQALLDAVGHAVIRRAAVLLNRVEDLADDDETRALPIDVDTDGDAPASPAAAHRTQAPAPGVATSASGAKASKAVSSKAGGTGDEGMGSHALSTGAENRCVGTSGSMRAGSEAEVGGAEKLLQHMTPAGDAAVEPARTEVGKVRPRQASVLQYMQAKERHVLGDKGNKMNVC